MYFGSHYPDRLLWHKDRLEAIKQGEFAIKPESVTSLGIADYVVDAESRPCGRGRGEPKPDMSYADALIPAMKKEKAS